MARVSFNGPEEFLEELERDRSLVERDLVRVTGLYRRGGPLPMTRVALVATAKVAGDVLRLELEVGSFIAREDAEAHGVMKRLGERRAWLEAELARLKLEVRTGMLEP